MPSSSSATYAGAVRNSARTGGGYGVYRRDDDGTYPVAIEVNIKPETQACRRCDSPLRHGCGLLWAI